MNYIYSITSKEETKIRHEINSLYFPKYEGLELIAHRSVGLDNRYYIYILENRGFDCYKFIVKYENLDDEETYR